ncbi:MAG TPA: helix-turn-helix transcriptional regulator [Clostridiales bacterium]|nr:helix-turn-helix transcriptional regulator [Clostridiales bacterium]
MNYNQNFRLKEYRKMHKMTQKDLARLVNVSSDYISQLERGRRPGMVTAIKIARIFDTTLENVFFQKIVDSDFTQHKVNK